MIEVTMLSYMCFVLSLVGLFGLTAADGELVERATCIKEWDQCGGIGYNGTTCCISGTSCSEINSYYYQCVPVTAVSSLSVTVASSTSITGVSSTSVSVVCCLPSPNPRDYFFQLTPFKSSGATVSTAAASFSGATVYTTTSSLLTGSATAKKTQAAYPAATSGACGSWTLVENVCCPSYCGNDDTSSSCSGLASCNCTTPPADMCKSGTMYPEKLSVSPHEDWHYSVSLALDQPRWRGILIRSFRDQRILD
jgi:hypothetical protein